ncbi:FAD-binding protein [Afipia sp. TerB]
MDTLKVRDAKDVEEAVRGAVAAEQPLEVIGHGSKRAIGQPTATNAVLDLSALNGVTSYEPNELIITVQAGAPLADVLSLIDSKNQEFAFDPMNTSVLLGTPAQAGTIGGMIGAGLAGPRRIKAGGARDHLLGATSVSGFGDTFVTGGKVVKNVTGYDICKILTGSWGTLSVMTEVTLKVMPKAESEITLVLHGLDDVAANRAMTAALGSPFDVSGAAHLPEAAFGDANGPLAQFASAHGVTLLRLESIKVSVAERAKSLAVLLAEYGKADLVEDEASRALWAAIRDVTPFAAAGARGSLPVWRIVCPPAAGGAFGAKLARETGADVYYDWGGGLIWAALPEAPDAHAKALRASLTEISGHATLLRGSETVRSAIDVFQPQSPGVAALSRRIKNSFDPRNILNRGRMTRDSQ